MSEIIDLESNNLCTTEDAFEKFQAVSMYEEDQFITLSDIVTPSQPSDDISKILSEAPGDETLVSLQDSGPSVKSVTCLHDEKVENISECNTTEERNTTTVTVKKRGRKKKNGFGTNSYQNKSVEQNQVEQSKTLTPVDTNVTLPTCKDSDLNYDMVIEEDTTPLPSTNIEKVINKPTRNIKRNSYNSEILDVRDINNTSISKRGRPRKTKNIVDVKNIILSEDQNKKSYVKGKKRQLFDETNFVSIRNDGSNDFSLKKSKKKYLKNNSTSAEDIGSHNDLEMKDDLNEEDIPLVAFSSKSKIEETNVNNLELETNIQEKTLNDSSVTPSQETNIVNEKSPKKRGRPKRNNINSTSDVQLSLDLKESEQDISKEEVDDVSLSKLKNEEIKSQCTPSIENVQLIDSENTQESEEPLPNDTVCKRNLKKPTMSDFEYNIDSIIRQDEKSETEGGEHSDSITKESSRPVRRKAKKYLDYDEGSDEDPYANIELSDDEPPRRKKGNRYFSDDEYIPGSKHQQTDISDSDIEENLEKTSKIKKKRFRRLDSGLLSKSPKKRSKKTNGDKINSQEESSVDQGTKDADDELEVVLNTTVVKGNEDPSQKKLKEDYKKSSWGESNEFENFLAKIVQGTDIKIKKANPIDYEKGSLQIPVLDPTEVNKKVEMFTQTTNVITKPVAVQTNTLYDIPMKNQVALTAQQSEKACEFLTGIVKTTSELGQLMTQKSEDFIEKKINTKHVTDTFKMDYCVKKSFLLFKLAKHNLVQMEEDLSKHYDEFLKANDLLKHREEQKIIASTSKTPSGDSDCEIVEEPVKELRKQKEKPAFNPKTVFLNKELSIKIAKKPTEKPKPKEKLNIKGRHTVWINDSVMVKKVKPTQSFLAQDSRNKKPPDTFITLKMVSDFFKMYNRQKALQICAPYVKNEWFLYKNHACCYFFENQIDFHKNSQITHNEEIVRDSAESEPTDLNDNKLTTLSKKMCPHSLSLICMQVLQKYLCLGNSIFAKRNQDSNLKKVECTNNYKNIDCNSRYQNVELFTACSLKNLCFNRIKLLICDLNFNEIKNKIYISKKIQNVNENELVYIKQKVENSSNMVKSLFTLCVELIQDPNSLKKIDFVSVRSTLREIQQKSQKSEHETKYEDIADQKSKMYYNPHTLKQIVFDFVNSRMLHIADRYVQQKSQKSKHETKYEDIADQKSIMYYNPHSLKQIVFDLVKSRLLHIVDRNVQQKSHKSKHETKYKNIADKKTVMIHCPHSLKKIVFDTLKNILYDITDSSLQEKNQRSKPNVKTLVQICIDFILSPSNDYQNLNTIDRNILPQNSSLRSSALSLSSLSLNKMMALLNAHYESIIQEDIEEPLNFIIDNVNTISEERFFENTCQSDSENFLPIESYVDNDELEYYDEDITNYQDEYRENDNNWLSQVQMQELRSCTDTTTTITQECNTVQQEEIQDCLLNIKVEPLEENIGVDSSNIKIEPLDVDETNLTSLDSIRTKQENIVSNNNKEPMQRKNSNSYDVDVFEAFVASNKMIFSICSDRNEEVFTQSTSRVRRQYEPDIDDDIDSNSDSMNLLVPQNVEVVKGRLMQSSSDEGENKVKEKKKLDKRKVKSKKTKKDVVQPQSTKEKSVPKNDVAALTKRMRDKIRQEEAKFQCSDSEEDMSLNLRSYKGNKDKNRKMQSYIDTSAEQEIQCSDVDSTEKIYESEVDKFIIKQNEIANDNKDTNLNKETQRNDSCDNEEMDSVKYENEPIPSLINEPVEHIECQPTVSLLQNNIEDINNDTDNNPGLIEILNKHKTSAFVDRHGWKCYPIDSKDNKIYQNASVSLVKLPESFVDTYFRYQDVTEKTLDDAEIDKLTNLNSLRRTIHNQTKDKNCGEVKENKQSSNEPVKRNISNESLQNPVKEEPCDELSPSEDEKDDFEDNFTVPPPQQSIDNCLAKDSLMNDDDDDDDECESEKVEDDAKQSKVENKEEGKAVYKTRSGRLIKSKGKDILKPEELMLTADKMMNKELSLLNAPIEIKEEVEDKKDVINKPIRNSHKNATKSQVKKEQKEEDDSSSEEEKQWFTTKEKLLKRLQKKQDIPNVDDAKRAKIVSEFIEKRGDNIETRQRNRPKRRSKKKLLERRKQMKILSRELFGGESSHTGIKYTQAPVSKGRRNIRKVLDKKSLRRNTVLANMDEFERKQRLSQRQAQLREVLGCEEGVNVVVINDELCLEYDFEEHRPVVSVHPFFTKVMKAHQYEGVKFMWDACFESVSTVASSAGSGCILAHCMGLGKTLQVLALLHTVLTHPKVNMRRVLVCCPLSTVLNWVDEINKWIGPVTDKLKVFELSKLKKTYERAYQLEDWYKGGGIFIIGYELFRSLTTLDPILDNIRPTIVNKIRTALLDPGPDIIICDEGHLLKNDCSVLAVAMSRVVTKRRIVLTGTPMQNNLREYYCMVNFVKPNLLGTYSEYSNRFENPIMNGQHRDSREEDIKLMKARTHILHKVLEGCLQRLEASVLYPYLPKKHEYTVFISLTQCQRDLYNHYLMNYTKETKQSILKDFHVLQKIWTHPQVLHNFLNRAREDEKEAKIKVEKLEDDLAREDLGASEDVKPGTTETWWLPHVADDTLNELRASNKFLVVFRLLDECVALGDKVLIFSTSLYTMDALEFFLRERSWALGREYYRLDGSVPAEVRQKWCREFNAPNNTTTKLFLISTRAGCLGLNMTAANRVIILDTSWNPAHDIQSIFRVYRFGQKKDCFIYRLVAMGTMEQKIYERSVTKQAVACRVVDEQQIDRHYNMSDLSELYKLDEAGSTVSAGLAAGVRDAALLRVARADEAGAALYAVHEHDSLLRSSESGLNETERAAAWTQFQQEQTATHTIIENIKIKDAAHKNNKIVIKTETPIQEVPDQSKNTTTGKSKRKRKCASNSYTDPQPPTSQTSDSILNPEAEEQMIQKIMNILIKHNFHTTKSPQEISDLVVGVRNAKQSGLENANPLIASIAKVLLENENNDVDTCVSNCTEPQSIETIIGVPNHVDTINIVENNESNTAEEEYSDRKRRRTRRLSDEEYVPEKTRKKKKVVPKAVTSTEKPNTRKMNANILSSNSNNESLNMSIRQQPEAAEPIPIEIDINKSLESQFVDSDVTKEASLKEVMKKKEIIAESSTKCEQKSVTQNKVDINTTEESIVLSDEDDEPLATIYSDNSKSSKEDNNETDDIIPLHESLLTNKNFIKIVAHTYLSGNPKLDEDAAILAAQYSTLKALKEIKATGKDITSGPIYDIAVQVLGKSLLKKLHKVRVNLNETIKLENIGNQTDSPAKSLAEFNVNRDNIPVKQSPKVYVNNFKKNHNNPETSKDTKIKNKNHSINEKTIKLLPQDTEPNQKYLVDSNHLYNDDIELRDDVSYITEASMPGSSHLQNVVPVGIFKGPASIHTSNMLSSKDECILPDDDDVIINPLTTSQVNVTPPITQNKIKRRNSKQLHVTSVVSENVKTTPTMKNETVVKPATLIAVHPFSSSNNLLKPSFTSTKNSLIPNTETNNYRNTQKSTVEKEYLAAETSNPVVSTPVSETICLDSDEEDVASTVCNNTNLVRKPLKSTTKLPNRSLTIVAKNSSTPTIVEIQKTPRGNVSKIAADTLIKRFKNSKAVQSSLNTVQGSDKPSNIIRITETGAIELLKRNAMTSATVNSFTAINGSQAQNFEVPETITGDLNTESQIVSDKATSISDSGASFVKPPKTKAKNLKSLSLLRNIIHIPADNYGESNLNNHSNSDNVASMKASSVTCRAAGKVVIPLKNDKNVQKRDTSSIITIKEEKAPRNVFASTSNRNDKEKVIDLTESILVNNDSVKKVTLKKKDFVAIAGSSKDIIINKMGVLLNSSKTQSAPVKEMTRDVNNSNNKSNTIKNVTLTLKKVQLVKRPSPSQEPPTNKKPKPSTAKPLTLKDFNLDDIDDIIELE